MFDRVIIFDQTFLGYNNRQAHRKTDIFRHRPRLFIQTISRVISTKFIYRIKKVMKEII